MNKVFRVNAFAQGREDLLWADRTNCEVDVMETVDDAGTRIFTMSAWYRRKPQPPSASAIMRNRLEEKLKLNLVVFLSRLQRHALEIELRQQVRLQRFSEHTLLCDMMVIANQLDAGNLLCVRRLIWSTEQLVTAVFGWSFNVWNGGNALQERWHTQHHNRNVTEFQRTLIPGLRSLCVQLLGADADLWFTKVELEPMPTACRPREGSQKTP